MATREEMIEYRVSTKGETPEVAATKVDTHLRATGREKEITGAAPKPAPKATPPAKAPPKVAAAKTPEPPKPTPAVAAQVPKMSDFPTGQVPTVGGGYYAPAAFPRSAPTPRVTDREIADAAAEQGIRTWSPMAAKAPPTATPSVMKYADEADMRDYSNGGGWQFTSPQEVPAMREKLKKLPHLAKLDVDKAPESDIRELYAEEFGR